MAQAAAAGLTVGGGLLKADAIRKETAAEEKALKGEAQLRRLEALEILDRSLINQQTIQVEGEILKGQQKLDFSSRGVDVGSGSALSVIEESNAEILRQVLLERRRSRFEADQREREASSKIRQAGDVKRAGKSRQLSNIFSTGGSFLGGVS